MREGQNLRESLDALETKWFVLPFHFVWECACLASVANKFLQSQEAVDLWSRAWGTPHDFKFGIACKSTFPPVATLVKNRRRLDGEEAA